MNCARFFLAVTTLLVAASSVRAVDLAMSANPYSTVITRNIFGLVPIPTNAPVDVAAPEPPIKITPNGIMSIFGKVQVLFKTPGKAKPGQPAKEESYVMSVGERQDEIEVLAINEAAGQVKFNNHGMIQDLALVAAANVPSPVVGGGAGGVPLGASGLQPIPGGVNNGPGGGRFGRSARGKNVTSSEDLAPASAISNASGDGSGSVNHNGVYQPSGGAQAMSPEAQILMIEAQREKYKAENNPIATMLPPTVLTPPSDGGATQNQ